MSSHSFRVQTAATTTIRETPKAFFDWIDSIMHFTIDVCASQHNAKHARFYSEKLNGLVQDWEGETFWCNPPYGAPCNDWLPKCRDAAMNDRAMGCVLIPKRTDAEWYRKNIMMTDGKAGRLKSSFYNSVTGVFWFHWEKITVGIYDHNERLCFDGLEGAPFASCLVFFFSPSRRPQNVTSTVLENELVNLAQGSR